MIVILYLNCISPGCLEKLWCYVVDVGDRYVDSGGQIPPFDWPSGCKTALFRSHYQNVTGGTLKVQTDRRHYLSRGWVDPKLVDVTSSKPEIQISMVIQ